MAHENRPEDRNAALAAEVWSALEDFYSFVNEPERRAAFGEANWQRMVNKGGEIEDFLADIDPDQSRKALELEDVLSKLHGCVVSYMITRPGEVVGEESETIDGVRYVRPIRGEPQTDEFTVYVKDHVVDTSLGWWMVGISMARTPITAEDLDDSAGKGWFIQPLGDVHDFRVIATNHQSIAEE